MRILMDNGIFSHSEFAEDAIRPTEVLWGDIREIKDVYGYKRKAPHADKEYQSQIEAIFTVGRLIREGKIKAYDYIEIFFEKMRDKSKIHVFNAMKNCQIHRCRPALERTKFRRSINFIDTISKGGKKDRKAGVELGEANQIAVFEWFCSLNGEFVDLLIQHAVEIGLTDFEVESLRNIGWFQFLCQRSGSPENYPDVFHLWAAERNGFDAFLTLEKRLPNLVCRVKSEKDQKFEIQTEVLRPLDLLHKLGIEKPDPVPIEADRFYYWHEPVDS